MWMGPTQTPPSTTCTCSEFGRLLLLKKGLVLGSGFLLLAGNGRDPPFPLRCAKVPAVSALCAASVLSSIPGLVTGPIGGWGWRGSDTRITPKPRSVTQQALIPEPSRIPSPNPKCCAMNRKSSWVSSFFFFNVGLCEAIVLPWLNATGFEVPRGQCLG